MKKILFIPLFLSMIAMLLSCEKEIKETGTASPVVSLNDVRALYAGSPKVLSMDDMFGASYISGVVISDPANGNEPDGLVILQSLKRKLLRGIALELGNSATDYHAGDSLLVKIEGKTLNRVDGLLRISGLSTNDVTRISEDNTQHINISTTTFTDVTQWMEMYESTLVKLRSVVVPDLVLGDLFEGTVTLSDWSNSLSLITKSTASFAADSVPGFGDYTGILLQDAANKPVLMLRSADDYEAQSLEPYHPGELYANFPEGWEASSLLSARKGSYPGGTGGNYETYLSGEWYMPNSYTMSGGLTIKSDTFGLMMRNGFDASVAMNFNLPYGASRFSFDFGIAVATNAADLAGLPVTVKVEYSQDSGNSWQLSKEITVTTANKYVFDEELDIKGPVRFRISKNNSGSRVAIDQIAVYQN